MTTRQLPTPPPNKPPHGERCNRCGWCCQAVLCNLARHLFAPSVPPTREVAGPCPALEEGVNGEHACGLAVHPATYAPVRAKAAGNATLRLATTTLIGEGIGCDSFSDQEPENEGYTWAVQRLRDERESQIRAAWAVWGRTGR